MRSVRLAAFAALSSLAFSSSLTQARGCWFPEEAEAAQVRGLHLMLMTGTLQCRAAYPRAVDLYNDFVEQQRDVLVDNVEVLKGHFMRESGSRWQNDSDAFETSLANLYSARLDDGGYCGTVAHFARMAADASRSDLLLMAESVADAPVSGVCTRPEIAPFGDAGYGREPERRAPPKVALSDALRAPVPPVKTVAVEPVAVEPAVDAEPVVVAAVIEPVAAPAVMVQPAAAESQPVEAVQAEAPVVEAAAVTPAPSREQALEAAVAALQSAVVALQAAGARAPAKGQ